MQRSFPVRPDGVRRPLFFQTPSRRSSVDARVLSCLRKGALSHG
ncbi:MULTISPECIES: hypothetical protein [unclassified Pseudomonas]|nr:MULTISPECIES: hypothetical protein [unclassified Pseudomonas]